LKPPFVANVKNSVPVVQKHVLRGKMRLDRLRNLKTRFVNEIVTRKLWKPNTIA